MFVALQTAVGLTKRDLGPVLVIDADIDSALTHELKTNDSQGFCQVLEDVDVLQSSIRTTSYEGVHFLPIGNDPLATRKLSACSVAQAISKCKSAYRYLCFCGGNVNEKIATSIAASCDATYLVIDLAQTDQGEVEQTVKRLNDCGARTLGCISLEH